MGGLTAERVRDVLTYDPATGVFRWRVAASGRVQIGMIAGRTKIDGYRGIKIDGKEYQAHRLAWLYVHGFWPACHIDHINGIRNDNRLSNLRDVSRSENAQNQYRVLGVCLTRRKFQAQIKIDGKSRYLGRFETAELAHQAYIKAKRRLHPAGML